LVLAVLAVPITPQAMELLVQILFLVLLQHQQAADLVLVIREVHQELAVLAVLVEAVAVKQVVREVLQLLGKVVRAVLHQQVVEGAGALEQLVQTALALQVVMVVRVQRPLFLVHL
jgi:hypothetical protein